MLERIESSERKKVRGSKGERRSEKGRMLERLESRERRKVRG